jgi:hypothetical protein
MADNRQSGIHSKLSNGILNRVPVTMWIASTHSGQETVASSCEYSNKPPVP